MSDPLIQSTAGSEVLECDNLAGWPWQVSAVARPYPRLSSRVAARNPGELPDKYCRLSELQGRRSEYSMNSKFLPFLAVLLPVMGFISLDGAATAQGDLPCERETIALSVSPDETWVALVQEGMCISGRITVSTNTVRLARRDSMNEMSLVSRPERPEYENDVLVVDYYGRPETRPLLHWLSPRKLQITIPNISGVGLQKGSYQDVEHEPDDPVAREKWQKKRGLMPK